MVPYASVADYRAVYDSSLDDSRLLSLLGKASRLIARACEDAGVATGSPDEGFGELLGDVCVDVVHRADSGVASDIDVPFGATQFSIGADGFSQSFSMGNPYGDLFLTKAERELLGIADDGSVGTLWPMAQADREDRDD